MKNLIQKIKLRWACDKCLFSFWHTHPYSCPKCGAADFTEILPEAPPAK